MNMRYGWAFPQADRFMMNEIQPDGSYQRSHLEAALAYVTDWSMALDCGAHSGTWSRILSTRFQHVMAIEPSPDTCEALRANMTAFRCGNVQVHEVALGAASGTVRMVLDEKGKTLANTGARYVQPNGDIPLVTIDSLALPTLGFLKLDVEGSEFAALLGARQTILRCKPIVLYEDKFLWQRFGVKREAPQEFLTRLGYRQLSKVSADAIWGTA